VSDQQGARRPVFIISTEGKTRDQIKAQARAALRRRDEAAPFVVRVDGSDPGRFSSLVDAMSYAETMDGATGVIEYDGLAVITYADGAIDLAGAPE
jgi:hypothetical protein